VTSELLLFRNNGDGTFASPRAVVSINVTSWSEGIQAATIADIDGDGIKDGVAVVATLDAALNQNYSLQFARGMADGSYVQIKTTSRWPAAPLIWCGVISIRTRGLIFHFSEGTAISSILPMSG
jgi:FG-GAP-like repeat